MSITELVRLINKKMKSQDYASVIHLIEENRSVVPIGFDKLRFYESYAKNKLNSSFVNYESDCICLNTTNKEIPKIESLFKVWKLWHLKTAGQACFSNLIIALDNEPSYEGRLQIDEMIKLHSVDEIFRKIQIIGVEIPDKYNFYRRDVDGSLNLVDFPYGYKSGPNYQFFSLIKKLISLNYRFVYLCETDTYPMSSSWANDLFDVATKSDDFWILGSPFLGESKIHPSLALHINGSAIYSLKSPGFELFLDEWERLVVQLVPSVPHVAYDWAWDHYFYERISVENWGDLTGSDFHKQLRFRSMCRYTDRIINLAGEPERAGLGRYRFDELKNRFPNISIVHGDYYLADFYC